MPPILTKGDLDSKENPWFPFVLTSAVLRGLPFTLVFRSSEWLTRGRTPQVPQPHSECMNGWTIFRIYLLALGIRAFANAVGFKQKRANWTKLPVYCPPVLLVVSGLTQWCFVPSIFIMKHFFSVSKRRIYLVWNQVVGTLSDFYFIRGVDWILHWGSFRSALSVWFCNEHSTYFELLFGGPVLI